MLRFLLVTMAFLAHSLAAQEPTLITLDRIHQSNDFSSQGFGPIRWLKDGSGYTTLESSQNGGRDIVSYGPKSQGRTILVAADKLVPKGRRSPLSIADYVWSDNGKRLLIFTNTARVWRYHTRGDYWVLNLASGELKQIAPAFEPQRLQFAKFSPDATRVAFVYKNDLFVESIGDSKQTRLTNNGTSTLINGTFDWVYEEEWGLRDGFRWSPDGKKIAFWQIDSSAVSEFVLINNTQGLYPKLTHIPYPKAGEKNPSARVGTIAATGGKITWVDLPGDASENYIARMDWAHNSDELLIQHVNRLQNTICVMLASSSSGQAKEVFRDEDPAWCEVCDDVVWLGSGKSFTWISEKDGWRHVYVISRDGKNVRVATPGEYDVVSIAKIDEAQGFIYFIASPDNATTRFLYRTPLAGGKPERLTPEDRGCHAYQISEDSRWAIRTWSTFSQPTRVDLVKLPSHEVVRNFVANEALMEKIAALKLGPEEFFKVDIGQGTQVDGWCIKPPQFDPKKKYPLLIYVYGEPAGQTTQDRWEGSRGIWHRMMAQMGCVVVSLDNHGTPAPRGRAWRKSVYRKIGILAANDQAKAVRGLLKKWALIVPERGGVWGWSGGGSMTLNALFRFPDLYKMGIAIAFVANQRYYDSIYQERYMGLPKDNVAGFRDGSPITHAKNLRGDLLIAYGTGDDNCHYQNCEALVDELIKHGKEFRMMSYPNRSHGIYEGAGTRKHLFTMMTKYIEEKLINRTAE
ncbi:MAG: dipeptidyl-peptidase-4 [Planctomycetota bacterium]|jgi:dipeptidyl-peptidase-4